MSDLLNVLLIENDSEISLSIQLLFAEIKDCNVQKASFCKEVLEKPPDIVPQLILLAHEKESYAANDHTELLKTYSSAFAICSLPSDEEEMIRNYLDAGANLIVIKNDSYDRQLTTAVQKALNQISERKDSLLSSADLSQSGEESLSTLLAGTLQPDETILHYRILEEIGEGGMGEIYLAKDLKLDRTVAIKVLPVKIARSEKWKKRLMREARAASALNHSNIVTIHSIEEDRGITFIVMEYVEGFSLHRLLKDGPLEFPRVLNIGSQTAEALSAAHRIGVIHRDIKPANIMITGHDHVKLLDFGLAKRVSSSFDENINEGKPSELSGVGAILGTVTYMSPEQTRGEQLDERSDIFSLGSVLYEAATGKVPFTGPSVLSIFDAIATRIPESPSQINGSLPSEFDLIIGRALEKNKTDRYASASHFAQDLNEINDRLVSEPRISTPHTAPKEKKSGLLFRLAAVISVLTILISAYMLTRQRTKITIATDRQPIGSIAVLPLLNLSAQPDEEYFADGLTESLISDLAKVRDLKVISRTSSMHYKGTKKPLPEIARELNVDAIVEGSVLRSGSRVRITVQLIRALHDVHLWSETYERAMGEIIALQSDLAQAITNEILKQTSPQKKELLSKKQFIHPEAYEAYIKGRYQWSKRTKDGLEKSVEYFREAIQIQPDYGIAYSALADSYQVMGSMRFLAPQTYLPLVLSAAETAVQLDDSLGEAHTSLAAAAAHDWQWSKASSEYQKAIQLNPNYATAHHWYSILLLALNDCDGAIHAIEKARELDPVSFIINLNVLNTLSHCGKYDSALSQAEKVRELNPTHFALPAALGSVYQRMGRYEDAILAFEQSWKIDERFAGLAEANAAELRKALEQNGVNGYWKARLKMEQSSEMSSKFEEAMYYALLQQKDQAFDSLEKAFQNHESNMFTIQFVPELQNLRSDARYTDLIRRMGFIR